MKNDANKLAGSLSESKMATEWKWERDGEMQSYDTACQAFLEAAYLNNQQIVCSHSLAKPQVNPLKPVCSLFPLQVTLPIDGGNLIVDFSQSMQVKKVTMNERGMGGVGWG